MKNLLYILCLFSFHFTFAQSELPESFGDYRTIENATINGVYAQGFYTFLNDISLEDSVALLSDNLEIIKSLKKDVDYEILKTYHLRQAAYVKWKFLSPKIEIIEAVETIILKPKLEKIDTINEKWDSTKVVDFTEEVIVFEEELNWLAYQNPLSNAHLSAEKSETIVWKWHKIPQKTIEKRKRRFYKNETWWLETLPDTFIVARLELKTVGNYQRQLIEIPAIIDTLEIIILYNNRYENELVYSNLKYRFPTYFETTTWRNILITEMPDYQILEIQVALKAKGYEVELSNKFDIETEKALIQFQKDNNLPIGQLDKETLKMLGLEQ